MILFGEVNICMKLERISGVFNDDNKFDIDLSKAQIREKELRDILGKAKVEVKTDSIWKGSKNLAVEFRCRGKPSGISVSQAEYYAFILDANTYTEGIIIIPIEKLLYLARKFYRLGKVKNGGDDNASEMVLIPIVEFVK
tara:strand:- start:229 stop:648 length:420 start_codon:yes stop_codon:yes gene_type:complete